MADALTARTATCDDVTCSTMADNNGTGSGDGGSNSMSAGPYEMWAVVLITLTCGIMVVGTVVGNILVCTAVAIVRRLRTPSNLLIVSLAVSDLLVAVMVMPFATMYEVMGHWALGKAVCDMWTSLDVLLCTASILNLCAISVDRYFVITRPFQYAMKRTPVRMAAMIIAVWVLSALISIPPLFISKSEYRAGQCMISQKIGYQLYATFGAFYLPLIVMIVIYTRIYLVSSRIAHAEARSKPVVGNHPTTSGSTTPLRKESGAIHDVVVTSHNGHRGGSAGNELLMTATSSADVEHRRRFRLFGKSRLNRISSSNERKATKTLGVIMGAFCACWLPFFILALIKPFCNNPAQCIPHWLSGLFLWLGYANSFLNPIIYARFNRDFRTPFKHILQCHVYDINSRLRSENYAEQFGGGGGGRMDGVPPTGRLATGGGPTNAESIAVHHRASSPPDDTAAAAVSIATHHNDDHHQSAVDT